MKAILREPLRDFFKGSFKGFFKGSFKEFFKGAPKGRLEEPLTASSCPRGSSGTVFAERGEQPGLGGSNGSGGLGFRGSGGLGFRGSGGLGFRGSGG